MNAEAEDITHLPELVQDFFEVIGLPAALRIVEAYSGVRLYVPKSIHEDHKLIGLLGDAETAKRFESVYAGSYLNIPRCVVLLRQRRNARLFKRHNEGASTRTLAIEFSLTERHVWNILALGPDDDRQLRLFT